MVREFVGHGIGRHLHEEPQIPNFGAKGTGVRLKKGMVLAIEPMINEGDKRHSNQGERMDGGDQGRKAFGSFRAHCCPHGKGGGDIERYMRVYAKR